MAEHKRTIYLKTENQRVRYNANDFFENDDELYMDVKSKDNFFYFVLYGYYYLHNPYDCVLLSFLNEEDAKKTNLRCNFN